jgi:hypothetical protein
MSWQAYDNNLKIAYQNVISYFDKLSRTISRVETPVDKLK